MTRYRPLASAALAATLAACARHAPPPVAPPPAPARVPVPAPTPPPVTINSDLPPEQSLWHLRSGLNVAALMCGAQPGGAELVGRYNALLVSDKAPFAAAYAATAKRFEGGDKGALDRHMTQVYNFFAKPGSLRAFCTAAGTIAQETAATPADALPGFAPGALLRLQEAVLAPPDPAVAQMRTLAVAEAPVAWRIQLGAYTGQPAAERAWQRLGAKLPSLAAYQPHYEPVPNSRLVRVRISGSGDRSSAIGLCATAAAGGFDCMPVAAPTAV